jgi:hypothetical protein
MTIIRHSVSLILGIIWTLLSLAAEADRYELVKGKGVEVCEAYEKNLNSVNQRPPMRCQRMLNPNFKDFAKPEWGRIDATTGVIPKIDEFLWKRDANPIYYVLPKDWAKWVGTKEQYAAARRRYLVNRERRFMIGHLTARVDIDIDNDGTVDNVYLDRACNAYGALLLVLNDKGSDIDQKKTELVMRHPSRAAQGLGELRRIAKGEQQSPDLAKLGVVPVEDSLHWAFYDVFLYKRISYFDLWWYAHSSYLGKPDYEVGELHVFSAKGPDVREVCTYRVVSGDK